MEVFVFIRTGSEAGTRGRRGGLYEGGGKSGGGGVCPILNFKFRCVSSQYIQGDTLTVPTASILKLENINVEEEENGKGAM